MAETVMDQIEDMKSKMEEVGISFEELIMLTRLLEVTDLNAVYSQTGAIIELSTDLLAKIAIIIERSEDIQNTIGN